MEQQGRIFETSGCVYTGYVLLGCMVIKQDGYMPGDPVRIPVTRIEYGDGKYLFTAKRKDLWTLYDKERGTEPKWSVLCPTLMGRGEYDFPKDMSLVKELLEGGMV